MTVLLLVLAGLGLFFGGASLGIAYSVDRLAPYLAMREDAREQPFSLLTAEYDRGVTDERERVIDLLAPKGHGVRRALVTHLIEPPERS